MTTQRCVVIFDLDGTLTRRDSYVAYLAGFFIRHPWRLPRVLTLPLALFKFAVGRLDNTELKRHCLHAVLGGASQHDVAMWTRTFVDCLVAKGLRRDALDMLERYRQRGDLLVLLTASFDLYVHEVARRLGFEEVICTKAEWVDGRLSGRLAGPNHRGEEKVRCLLRLRHDHVGAPVIAYADHHTDLAFLGLADCGILVNGTSKTRQLAKQKGIACAIWKR
jgi:phosphatidylglycerophosphatase C